MDNNYYYPVLWLVIGALVIALVFAGNGIELFRKKLSADADICAQCNHQLRFLALAQRLLWGFVIFMVAGGAVAMYTDYRNTVHQTELGRQQLWPKYDPQKIWTAPDPYLAETDDNADLIQYGRDLIAHTQDYFGKSGIVKPGAINGLNCQSCHLDAGTKPFGNNYFAVYSTYPQMRARSGALETIPKRINDCFQRSLNGQALDTTSREMLAMLAYMRWLGTGIPKGEKPKGSGLMEPVMLTRYADPTKGALVYEAKCASCHGEHGEGLPMPNSDRHYPPLWGDMSYNEGAGLFRLSRFAGYVKANMPFGATYDNPQLTDEECWDVGAFVNAQPRPLHPFLATDWPKVEKKPFDHPFGPYRDSFPEIQHKLGPFEPIIAYYKAQSKK